jgi:hypothetical protein
MELRSRRDVQLGRHFVKRVLDRWPRSLILDTGAVATRRDPLAGGSCLTQPGTGGCPLYTRTDPADYIVHEIRVSTALFVGVSVGRSE